MARSHYQLILSSARPVRNLSPAWLEPDTQTMTPEEDYRFDVAGYLILRNVLSEAELRVYNRALDEGGGAAGMLEWPAPLCDSFVQLGDHPLLAQYLEQLGWGEYRLDQPPHLIDETTCAYSFVGGNEPRNSTTAPSDRLTRPLM
jgi:hypothetical protein